MIFHRVLVPIDFSATSIEAVRLAVALVRGGGRLELLTVGVLPDPSLAGPAPSSGVLVEIASRMAESRGVELDAVRRREVPAEVESAVHLREGNPAEQIVAAATELGCDLIVLGTHGRTGLEHLVLGSVAERVTQRSPVPVLVTRAAPPVG